MVLNLPEALLAAAAAWAIGITLGFLFLFRRFSRLTAGTKRERLDEILAQLSEDFEKEHQSHRQIEKEMAGIKNQLPNHLQKISLVRFNPFAGTGSNQSFSLALLDGGDSGLIITSLHNRDGTRLYTKPVIKGKSQGELSKEEQSALEKATNEQK